MKEERDVCLCGYKKNGATITSVRPIIAMSE